MNSPNQENLPSKETFQEAYSRKAPWDIGKPQQPFVDHAGQIEGTVLDVGCGTGDIALFFAERGCSVTGIDYLNVAIDQAKEKAGHRNLHTDFRVMDAMKLDTLKQHFDNVIDCGLFHIFSDEDRKKYVTSLASVTANNSRIYMLCFSDKEPGDDGPRRITQAEIQEAFSAEWQVESISEARFEVRPDFDEIEFSDGGPFGWFSVIRRL